MKNLLSLCMIVKNEENNIKRCLDSVKELVDEMIVVDTGSDDSTVSLAESYGASVYKIDWKDDFSIARNYSLDHANGEWILLMDADDELDRRDIDKVRQLLLTDAEAYYFKTVSYVGPKASYDAAINLNLRLMKNRPGYRFIYPIHEQIGIVIKNINPHAKILDCDIRVNHYGYLDDEVSRKNKRKRNMKILGKVLDENPNDPFMRFNMGNEYFALSDYKRAFLNYEISLKYTEEKTGYLSKLYIRMILCNNNLKKYDASLSLIKECKSRFKNFTDIYFLEGYIHQVNKRYTIAERLYKKCIKMGEPPIDLAFLPGVGSYRAYQALGSLYLELFDYDEAYGCFENAYKTNRLFKEPLYKMCEILLKIKDVAAAKDRLEKLLATGGKLDTDGLILLYNIFLRQKRYDVCLEYLNELSTHVKMNDEMYYLKGQCLFNLHDMENAYITWSNINKSSRYFECVADDLIIISIIKRQYDNNLLKYMKTANLLKYNVYDSLIKIMEGIQPDILSDKEDESIQYTDVIFKILDKLLYLEEFNLFEKSLNILNLVEDKTVLLKLCKLYNRYGFKKLAEDEALRSMKLFNIYDEESLNILYSNIKGKNEVV